MPRDDDKAVISRRTGARRQKGPGRAPRLEHGTEVRFNVICARCGAEDTLPFVPKTQGELLCQQCARETFGPDWSHGRAVTAKKWFPFACARCGREGRVPFEPEPGRELLCDRCMRGEEPARKERLKGMKKVE